jgi:hypothetical protein
MPFYIGVGSDAPGLKVGGTDLTNHVRSIEVTQSVADVDVTAMGAVTQQHAAGLRDDRIVVEFYQDFAAASVDAVISTLVGNSTGATIIAYAKGVTASATAPSYTMVGSAFDYSPINVGSPGEASTTEVTFMPVAGSSITRGTA